MKKLNTTKPLPTHADQYIRLPGLFRRWEFEQVIEIGRELFVDEAGRSQDGTELYAIYYRQTPEAG